MALSTQETTDAVLSRLTAQIEALEQRVAALEGSQPDMPEECRRQECSYYSHYLAYGGPDLTHDGFHAAEKRCEQAQHAVNEWFDEHPDGPDIKRDPRGRYLWDAAERWERAVRA